MSAPTVTQRAAPVSGGAARVTDVSRLLGVGTPGARLLLALYVGGNLAFTFSTLDAVASPWPSIVAVLMVSAAAVPLVIPHPDPFPLEWTLWILIAVALSTALISWQLAAEGDIGREAWHLGANTWLLFFVTMRGRVALAWVGFAAMAGITVWWAIDVGRGVTGAILMVNTHAGILLVATLFRGALVRASRRINSLNRRSLELAAATASSSAEKDIRRQRVAELAELATPLLSRLARGDGTSQSERMEYLIAEATLRDSVRARSLHLPEIAAATAEARKRGVEVTLLDDRGGGLPTVPAMRRLTERITEALGNVNSGRLTVRLAPVGREVAASIVVESGGTTRRIDLDAEGHKIPTITGI